MIGEKILKLREENNLSQSDLADMLDVSRQTVSKWECGNCESEISKVIKLSKLFKVSTDYLLGIEKELVEQKSSNIKNTMLICIVATILGLIVSFLCLNINNVVALILYILSISVPSVVLICICKNNKSNLYQKYLYIIINLNTFILGVYYNSHIQSTVFMNYVTIVLNILVLITMLICYFKNKIKLSLVLSLLYVLIITIYILIVGLHYTLFPILLISFIFILTQSLYLLIKRKFPNAIV